MDKIVWFNILGRVTTSLTYSMNSFSLLQRSKFSFRFWSACIELYDQIWIDWNDIEKKIVKLDETAPTPWFKPTTYSAQIIRNISCCNYYLKSYLVYIFVDTSTFLTFHSLLHHIWKKIKMFIYKKVSICTKDSDPIVQQDQITSSSDIRSFIENVCLLGSKLYKLWKRYFETIKKRWIIAYP